MGAKRKSLTGPIRTIRPPISEVKTRSHCSTVVDCRTRDPEVPSSNPGEDKKKISHRSNQNNTTTNPYCTRLQYLKLSEVKTRCHLCHTVVECRTRDAEVLSSNPGVCKMKYLLQVQWEQYYFQSPCTRVKYLKLSEVKSRSHCGTVVECRTRDPELPSPNPRVGNNKIFHGSNQNNTTTNPSALGLNTWNCQRWKPEVMLMAQW